MFEDDRKLFALRSRINIARWKGLRWSQTTNMTTFAMQQLHSPVYRLRTRIQIESTTPSRLANALNTRSLSGTEHGCEPCSLPQKHLLSVKPECGGVCYFYAATSRRLGGDTWSIVPPARTVPSSLPKICANGWRRQEPGHCTSNQDHLGRTARRHHVELFLGA